MKARYRIEHQAPDKPPVLIDLADTEEDALDFASCHCENLPETELHIINPEGNIIE